MYRKEIKSWLVKHWRVLISRPTNGHATMEEIDKVLGEISAEKDRIRSAVRSSKTDAEEVKKEVKKALANAAAVKNS